MVLGAAEKYKEKETGFKRAMEEAKKKAADDLEEFKRTMAASMGDADAAEQNLLAAQHELATHRQMVESQKQQLEMQETEMASLREKWLEQKEARAKMQKQYEEAKADKENVEQKIDVQTHQNRTQNMFLIFCVLISPTN